MDRLNANPRALIFSTAIAIRLAFFGFAWSGTYASGELRPSDATGYDRIAINLVEANGFSRSETPPYGPDLNRTPLYPTFLAAVYYLFGHHPWIAILLQIGVGASISVLILQLERQILGSYSTGASGWIMAVYPLSVVYDNTILTESLFTGLLVVTAILFIRLTQTARFKYALLCGGLCGLSTMCRPIATYLVLFLTLYLALSRPCRNRFTSWKRLIVVCLCLNLGFCAVVLPWVVRNLQVVGSAGISQIGGGADVWLRPLSYVRAIQSGKPIWGTYLEILNEYETLGSSNSGFLDKKIWRFRLEAAKEIANSQPPYPVLHAWGTFVTLFSPQTALIGDLTGGQVRHVDALIVFGRDGFWSFLSVVASSKGVLAMIYIIVSSFASGAIYALATLGVMKKYPNPAILLFLLIATYLVLPVGAVGDGRHRVPAMPFFALLSSAGLAVLREHRYKFSRMNRMTKVALPSD